MQLIIFINLPNFGNKNIYKIIRLIIYIQQNTYVCPSQLLQLVGTRHRIILSHISRSSKSFNIRYPRGVFLLQFLYHLFKFNVCFRDFWCNLLYIVVVNTRKSQHKDAANRTGTFTLTSYSVGWHWLSDCQWFPVLRVTTVMLTLILWIRENVSHPSSVTTTKTLWTILLVPYIIFRRFVFVEVLKTTAL